MNLTEQRIRKFFGARFSEHLNEWMKKNGKTQKDFCAAAGVSKNIVTAWKHGDRFPRDAQMQKICEVFGVDQRAFETFFSGDKQYVYNENAVRWSNQLQEYANQRGLSEEWYQFVISLPDFLRRFPFELPPTRVMEPDKEFDLVKYQFEDETGHRIMMSKGDIDFLIQVQNKTVEWLKYKMHEQKQKNERREVERTIDIGLRMYAGIDREEVLSRLYAVDLVTRDKPIEFYKVFDTIRDIANEKGIQCRISKAEIIERYVTNNPLTSEEWKKEWREWGRINAKEEEAERIIRDAEERNKKAAQMLIEDYRSQGILDE